MIPEERALPKGREVQRKVGSSKGKRASPTTEKGGKRSVSICSYAAPREERTRGRRAWRESFGRSPVKKKQGAMVF